MSKSSVKRIRRQTHQQVMGLLPIEILELAPVLYANIYIYIYTYILGYRRVTDSFFGAGAFLKI